MKIILISISPRKTSSKHPASAALVADYIGRAARYCPAEAASVESEAALLALAERQPGRAAGLLLLLDSRGEAVTSEGFAQMLGRLRDDGTQRLVVAIGPADGWSSAMPAQAQRTVSLGRITLPHELARVVAAEQIYRALTILAGHPYHSGH